MQFYRYPDAAHAAEACARHILGLLEERMTGGAEATFAISGGSSPQRMFEIFAATTFPWERVQLFWVDERAVPREDPQSNFKFANDTWLAPGRFPVDNIHAVDTSLTPSDSARRYANELRITFRLREGELPQFDVIHQGIGADCHTASLFPGEPLIEDRTGLTAAVWVEKFKQWRVTLLPGVLRAARHTVILAAGEDKAEAIQAALHGPDDPLQYPAQMVLRGRENIAMLNIAMFVDTAAMRLVP